MGTNPFLTIQGSVCEWLAGQGIDPGAIAQDDFTLERDADGSVRATGSAFIFDDGMKRLMDHGYAKEPWSATVTEPPAAVAEYFLLAGSP